MLDNQDRLKMASDKRSKLVSHIGLLFLLELMRKGELVINDGIDMVKVVIVVSRLVLLYLKLLDLIYSI